MGVTYTTDHRLGDFVIGQATGARHNAYSALGADMRPSAIPPAVTERSTVFDAQARTREALGSYVAAEAAWTCPIEEAIRISYRIRLEESERRRRVAITVAVTALFLVGIPALLAGIG